MGAFVGWTGGGAKTIAERAHRHQQRERGGCAKRRGFSGSDSYSRAKPYCIGGTEQIGEVSAERAKREWTRILFDSRAVGHARASGVRRLVSGSAEHHAADADCEWRDGRARYGE